jgi:hypothetical protein
LLFINIATFVQTLDAIVRQVRYSIDFSRLDSQRTRHTLGKEGENRVPRVYQVKVNPWLQVSYHGFVYRATDCRDRGAVQ